MEVLFSFDLLLSFLTLSVLEIVLGIDNLIFIALVVQNLVRAEQKKARLVGLSLALVMRVLMLLGIAWLLSLTKPLFSLFEVGYSFKDLLLLAGGLFLIGKSTLEMHSDIAGEHEERIVKPRASFFGVTMQIVLIDIVFSFDSVITAIGMTSNIPVIVAAMTVAMVVMVVASGYIASFLVDNPTFKILALSFILLIGTLLVAEGMHYHMPRSYVYFSFLFSAFVEMLNTLARRKYKLRQDAEKQRGPKR